MTDRELLELAAKAAGYWGEEFNCYKGAANWNPLDDDGDALRLAVKCNLMVCVGYGTVSACLQDDNSFHRVEHIADDRYAATRRVIVRAAAGIGRGMK